MISFIRKYYISYLLFFGVLLMPYFKPEMLENKSRMTAWIAGLVFASPFVILPIYIHFFRKKTTKEK